MELEAYGHNKISIHALREEGDRNGHRHYQKLEISIHALREEGDTVRRTYLWERNISIHALREEGDVGGAGRKPPKDISIHALREEGDEFSVEETLTRNPFLSTPSARRATAWSARRRPSTSHFYPRPPRGGRLALFAEPYDLIRFLSTPSARRATAKTETKSLFSNKLYNILHEFRRALIYNGSKNYPNHAKRLENPVRRCRKDAENSPFAPGRETQNNSRPSCSKGG